MTEQLRNVELNCEVRVSENPTPSAALREVYPHTMSRKFTILAACAAALLFSAVAHAGEKKLMHCFAFTSIKEATPAQWDAFFKATDAMPGKIKGVTKVWYGKLASPLSQYQVTVDADTRPKMMAGESVKGDIKRVTRDWGVCMEMADEATRKAYGADPYHKVWTDAYSKVRVEGTTTFDFVGQ
jgi:hypothetical protein